MGLAPQAKGAPPPGQLESAPSSAAEFVICYHTIGLQRALALEVMQAQCERAAHQMARKWLQLGNAA
jgi:hypothetical protein